MKLKRIYQLFILSVAVLTLILPAVAAENESQYGHVSFVEDQATIIRLDGAADTAVLNLPLVPGDTVVTGGNGRCELQFDNGTVIRLDKNTSLRITTLQAPTLTSSSKVTTLHLLQGQVYTLPQTYNREMFQIITPNAAVKLESRTAATIRFNADLSTTLFSDAGKFAVMYGADSRSLNKLKVKSGQAYVINADNTMAPCNEKRNLEFVAWNEYVDRHFKELHYGLSKVPPKLKFGNSALQYWAEKWSSRFGEWIYDDLFGYVWKPAAEQFANSARPFFYAEHVRINGQLFLVPQESWGWVPAHMGTWVWQSRGWTWIPGDWFHSGVVEFLGISTFPTMDYYFLMGYGYKLFRHRGLSSWRLDYLRRYYQEVWEQILESWKHKAEVDRDLDILPNKLADIIKRVNKGPAADVAERLGLDYNLSVIGKDKLTPEREAKPPNAIPDAAGKARPVQGLGARNEIMPVGGNKVLRDWNPDRVWAEARGYTIRYSSARNAVLCPELNISSDRQAVMRYIGVGTERAIVPTGVYIPENTAPAVTNSTGAEGSAARSITTEVQAEKKDDSGK
jgi:hypothetical protein